MTPFSIHRIDHLVLRVRDLCRSIDFYRDVLSCELVKRRDDLGLVHLRAGDSLIDLVSVDGQIGLKGGAAPGKGARNLDHFCLRIDPFDEAAIVAHLARFGVTPTGAAEARFGAQGTGLSLYFADPDGNVIEFKGPSAPADADPGPTPVEPG